VDSEADIAKPRPNPASVIRDAAGFPVPGAEQKSADINETALVVPSSNRDADARSATAKQDSPADAAYRQLINPA
jgi:hypothetical protein